MDRQELNSDVEIKNLTARCLALELLVSELAIKAGIEEKVVRKWFLTAIGDEYDPEKVRAAEITSAAQRIETDLRNQREK